MNTAKTTPARKATTRKVKPVEVAQAPVAAPVDDLMGTPAPAAKKTTKKAASTRTTTRKAPSVVASLDQAVAAAAEAARKRPILARNQAGELVTCCRSTARKNGWEVVQKLYKRARKAETTASDLI